MDDADKLHAKAEFYRYLARNLFLFDISARMLSRAEECDALAAIREAERRAPDAAGPLSGGR